ncbi:MAG: hypothetical protein ACE5NW_10855 [Acidiferrobacterales bacterium]
MDSFDPEVVWELLESLSRFFYDPVMFWGIPLVLAILWAIFRKYC